MRRLEMLSDSVPLFLRVQSRTSQRVPASGLATSLPLSQWAELTVIWSPSFSAVSPNEKLSAPASTEDSAVVVVALAVVTTAASCWVVVVPADSGLAVVVVSTVPSSSPPEAAMEATTITATTMIATLENLPLLLHQARALPNLDWPASLITSPSVVFSSGCRSQSHEIPVHDSGPLPRVPAYCCFALYEHSLGRGERPATSLAIVANK